MSVKVGLPESRRRARAKDSGSGGKGSEETAPERADDAGPVVANPSKQRRRPILIGLSVLLVILGAVMTAWLMNRVSDTDPVIAVASSVQRGEIIEASDLVVVQAVPDPGLSVIPADQIDSIVGSRAAVDLSVGGVLTPDSFSQELLPASGMSVVGVAVPATMLPATSFVRGDQVRVVASGSGGATTDEAAGGVDQPWVMTAEVVSVVTLDGSAGQAVLVDVLVPHEQAADLAARSGAGDVALILDSREG